MTEYEVFMERLGDEARTIARKYFRTAFDIVTKEDASPVTVADQEIEARLRALIADRYPDHGIMGEEQGGQIGQGYSWVIDPIDGTKSFTCGIPLYGTLVALLLDGAPLCGMIEIPSLAERWIGDGRVAAVNGEKCIVSRCTQLSLARLCATDLRMFKADRRDAFLELSEAVRITRFGTDSYGYALLATGYVDLVVEADLKSYDVMALVPVIEGAGGIVSTWSGSPVTAGFTGDIVAAATPELHAAALAILAAAAQR